MTTKLHQINVNNRPHFRLTERTTNFCSICDQDFKTASDFNLHLKSDVKCRRRFTCNTCNKSFTTKRVCSRHQRKDDCGAKKYFECDYCGKRATIKLDLIAHMSKHCDLRPYECNLCLRTFFAAFQLEAHLASSKHAADAINLSCDICKKDGFSARGSVVNHMKIHHIGHQFSCVHCGKKFNSLANLQDHEIRHTAAGAKKKNPFACGYCDKSYRHKSILLIHVRSHTGERPYVCPDCNVAFAELNNLQKHYRIHTGVKPFRCTVCDRRFNQLSSLRSHKKSHIEYKAFECRLCSKRFITDDDLTLHLRRIHGDKKMFKCSACDLEFDKLNHMKSHRVLHFGAELEASERDVEMDKWSNEILKKKLVAAKAAAGINILQRNEEETSTKDDKTSVTNPVMVNKTLVVDPISEFNFGFTPMQHQQYPIIMDSRLMDPYLY